VREESVPDLIQAIDLGKRVAILRKRAKQLKVTLPKDVALYIAQNVQSNAHAMELALIRLMAHSSMTGTAITLTYTQRVLSNFIKVQAREATTDPLQESFSQQFGKKEAKIRCQDPTAADRPLVFCLLKATEGRKTSRVRYELEVNIREGERARLARRDTYGRELEIRAKKRKQA
jgi:hypothetical protein